MIEILQREDTRLREVAKPLDFKKTTKAQLSKMIADMREALHSQDDGVAIAAVQIGLPFRIFVVSGRAFEIEGKVRDDLVCINPTLVKISKEKQTVEEGCLSVRWLYGTVKRARKATLEASDMDGKKFTLGASGLIAQIFQHEIDHLDGVLFIDKATDVEDIPPRSEQTSHA